MSANDYNEGDLVEGVKGESVIRGRLDNIGNLIIDGLDWRVASLIRNGFIIRVIEKAAPVVVLPTEYGAYKDAEGDLWQLNDYGWKLLTSDPPDAFKPENYVPFTRLEPVSETAKKVINTILSRRDMGHTISRTLGEIAKEFGVTV